MTLLNRGIISILVLSSLVSGCGAVKISCATGDASGSSGFTEILGAEISDEIHESTVLAGSSLSQTFKGSGDREETFQVTNNAGDQAEVGFDIKKSEKYSGSYTLSPQTAKYAKATEKLDVSNADSINAFANAYSRDGRSAEAIAMVTEGSLVGYSNSAYATSMKATVTQKVKSASCVGDMWFGERAAIFDGDNLVVYAGDQSISAPDIPPGNDLLKDYSGSASALKDSVQKDRTIGSLSSPYISDGPVAWNTDANGNVLTGSDTVISMTNGQISKYAEKVTATRNSAQVSMNIKSASGSLVEIKSNGLNNALGYENQYMWNPNTNNWDATLVSHNGGEGNFAAKNVAFKNVEVTTKTTKNDIDISTKGFGKKTALILDPLRWEFSQEPVIYIDGNGNQVLMPPGVPEIRDPIMTSLEQEGYAVTYYSDAAVSKTKVGQMDNYWVSVINTHMDPFGLALSKSSNGETRDIMLASELKKAYTKNNGMTLMVGCNSFAYRGKGTWADAVKKAQCSGGTTDYWSIFYSRVFLIDYFHGMAEGQTASEANQDIYDTFRADGVHLGDYNFEADGDLVGGYNDQGEPANPTFSQKKLYLAGSNVNFKL